MTAERKFIEENVKRVLLKEYLKRKTERSGFGGLDVQRTPMGTRVTLIAERPGMVIGRKGETIKELTYFVENEFKFDNPQIEVKEESNPNLNPHIMAQKLATALERGWHFRRAGHSTVRRIMSAGAKGCQIIVSGKLTGQRHRTEKFREGHIKYCGETKLDWIREGYAVAKKKLGVIGIKVQIMDPNAKLPDEIEVYELKDVATVKNIPPETKGEDIKDMKTGTGTEPVTEISTETETTATEIAPENGSTKAKKTAKDSAESDVKEDDTKAQEPKKSKKEKTAEKSSKKGGSAGKKKTGKKAKDEKNDDEKPKKESEKESEKKGDDQDQ